MKLLTLKLRNFKGERQFTLETMGGNVDIYGDNEAGKTTLEDAYLWLLFDKDSQNRKDFEIKTLDAHGNHIPGLDHEVEATFEIGNRRLTLRKVYAEKWTKKRGSAKAEFTGHETNHFIDGVPVKKNEYAARIEEIAREDIFRLLTNPMYFNTQLHWQERRNTLLKVCGDLTDAEVIASDKALAKLPDILQGRKLEDHRKVIAARRSEINKELDRIPVRIDEVEQSLPDIAGVIPEEITQKINVLKKRINEKNQQIARIEGGGEVAERLKELRETEARLIEIKNQHYAKYEAQVRTKQGELDDIKEQAGALRSEVMSMERMQEFNETSIRTLQEQMKALRAEWNEVNDQTFEYEQDETCPTCGQALPDEKLAQAREKAMGFFNHKKAHNLETISSKGKQLKAKADELAEANVELAGKLEEAGAKLNALETQAKDLQEKVGAMRMKMAEYDKDPAYIKALEQKQALEMAIADLKDGRQDELLTIQTEIRMLEAETKTCEGRLADIERVKQGRTRIEELKDQERKLAEEFERLEGELYLTEQFVRAKVAMLEERINSRFELARFKLFDVQVNGGVVECCETMYKGVPFGSLNNAARINVGIDIINTLAEHYGFTAPIFVDNAEAVTELIPARGQMIRLIVNERDKRLRVEYPVAKEMRIFEEAV